MGSRTALAEQLGIDPGQVRVVSPFVGGAFGAQGSADAAHRARSRSPPTAQPSGQARRDAATRDSPSRPTAPRRGTVSGSAPTADGKLVGYSHEGWEVTSRPDPYMRRRRRATRPALRLRRGAHQGQRSCTPTATRRASCARRPWCPTSTRSKARWTSSRVKLRMDPVELRRVNDTHDGPGHRQAVFEPLADAMLRRAGRRLRLAAARPAARRDARRRLADRLGLRDRGLSDPCRRPRRRACASCPHGERAGADRRARGRHRRLYRRSARWPRRNGSASRSAAIDRRARRFRSAAGAGRRRLQHDRQHLLGRDEGLRRDPREARARRDHGERRTAAGRDPRVRLCSADVASPRPTARANRSRTRSSGSASAPSRNTPSSCRTASSPMPIRIALRRQARHRPAARKASKTDVCAAAPNSSKCASTR